MRLAAQIGRRPGNGLPQCRSGMDRANGISFVALTNTTPTGMAGPFAVDLAKAVYGKK